MIAYEFNGNVCSQSIDEDILNLDCSIDVTSIMENYGNGVYTLNVLVSDEAGNFVDTNEFIGSQFALTPNNYQGSLITSVNTGNSICESEIGLGSEWIEFHEQWGWGINGNLVNVNQAERVWVWINDQNAECFSTNNQYGMTWDVVTYDNKATCNSDIGLFGSEYNPQMVNQDYYNVDYDRKCNAYQGDTPCYMERPLLCKYANTYFTIEETFENITGDIGDNESELNANITFCHEFTGDCSSTVLENGIFDVSGLWNTHYYTKVSSTDFTIIFDVVDFGLIQESSDFFNINYVKFPQKRIIEDGVSALAKLSVSSGDSNLFKEFSQLTLNYDLNNLNPSIPIVIYKCEDSNWNDIDQTCEGGLIKISVEPDPIAKEITIMEGNFTVYLLTQEDTGDNGSTGDNGGTGNGAPPTNDSFNQEADSEMEEESEDALMEEDLEEEEGVDQLNQVDEEDNDLEESESQQGYTTEDNNNFLMIIIIILIIGFLAWLKFRKKKT
jgi:LPXTG-motif cell wall-anchored protein